MLRNYITIAFRNLWRNKVFSAIKMMSLSIGITVFFLIILYVKYEKSYDEFHIKADNIFRIRYDYFQNGTLSYKSAKAFPGMQKAILAELPQVKNCTRIFQGRNTVKVKNIKFYEKDVFFVDTSFLNMFSISMIKGEKKPP